MEPVVLGRERVGAPRRARGAARGAAGPEPRDLVAERAGLGRARRGVGARARERVEVRVALGEERLEPRDLALRLGAGLGRLREAVAGEQRVLLLLLGVALRAVERGLGVGRGGAERGDLGLGALGAAVGAVRVRGERVGGRRLRRDGRGRGPELVEDGREALLAAARGTERPRVLRAEPVALRPQARCRGARLSDVGLAADR